MPDTNVWIAWLQNRSRTVTARLREETLENSLRMCSVVRAELVYGAINGGGGRKNLELLNQSLARYPSLPFDDSCCEMYGHLRVDLERQGKRSGHYDMLIAAIALTNDLILVTHNTRNFIDISGLKIEDWQSDDPNQSST